MPDPIPSHRRNLPWLLTQWLLRLLFPLWLRYRAAGVERIAPDQGGLILANHQSFLDPMLIGLPLARPVSYLARDSLLRVPLLGKFLRSTFVLPVNRDSAGGDSIRRLVDLMETGFLVGLFPEGTRTDTGALGELKPGFVSLVKRSDCPVYPVGIGGAFDAFPRGAWMLRPRPVRVVFGEPIPHAELERTLSAGREELLTLVRERIAACHEAAERWARDSVEPEGGPGNASDADGFRSKVA
jgi:1-acyl-sn-glycerol-3-phosphate acyltransferase